VKNSGQSVRGKNVASNTPTFVKCEVWGKKEVGEPKRGYRGGLKGICDVWWGGKGRASAASYRNKGNIKLSQNESFTYQWQ